MVSRVNIAATRTVSAVQIDTVLQQSCRKKDVQVLPMSASIVTAHWINPLRHVIFEIPEAHFCPGGIDVATIRLTILPL